jgi:3-dehydroquinate synthetase
MEAAVAVGSAAGTYAEPSDALLDLVATSVEIKASVVRRDERESGLRKTLNFGHTLGHAIELGTNYRLLHGEAVSIGMVLESELAEQLSIAERGTSSAIREAVRRVGLPTVPPADLSPDSIVGATHTDKKARAGQAE